MVLPEEDPSLARGAGGEGSSGEPHLDWRIVSALVVLITRAVLVGPASPQAPSPYAGLRRSELSNGLAVWTLERPDSRTVSFRVLVRVGFRDETADTYGLAHFTEHWMFTDTAAHTE